MSRNMDRHADKVNELKRMNATITEMGREKRLLEAQRSALENQLMKSMGNSVIGTINGLTAIEIATSSRRSASVSAIENVAPELYDKLVKINESKKIKVLDV